MDAPTPRPDANGSGGRSIEWSAALAQNDRWLRTVVASRVGDVRAVDEVMQEVALAAVAQRSPISDAAKLGPWLYRIAVVQSLLYRRRQGRMRKLTDRFARHARDVERDPQDGDPLGWLLADERRQLIRLALDRLARRDAEILLLKYTEDWSYRELAARIGISESAVEARLHRARARLRAELASLHVIEVSP